MLPPYTLLLHTSPGPFTYPFHFTSRSLLLKGTGHTWGAHQSVRQKLISRHLETQSKWAWRSGWAGKFSRKTILSVSHQHRSIWFLGQASKQATPIIECEEAQETIESNQPTSAVESLMQHGIKYPFTMATKAQQETLLHSRVFQHMSNAGIFPHFLPCSASLWT